MNACQVFSGNENTGSKALPILSEEKIPIRNIWHMLLYAWNRPELIENWRSTVESAPTLDALLAGVLAHLVRQRLRIGLGGDFRTVDKRISSIRGRILFPETIRSFSLEHGKTTCRFTIFSHNIPSNQIIRSTLSQLLHSGDFGERSETTKLRARIRSLVRSMEHVSITPVRLNEILAEEKKRHDRDYSMMLAICRFLAGRLMPTESAGKERSLHAPRSAIRLYELFERFVANFYKHTLRDWSVRPQHTFRWPAESASQFLPTMQPDIVFEHRSTSQIVMLDTKFTAKSLVENQYGNLRFARDHIFQIYAYVRSQEDRSVAYRNSTGILLYPVVGEFLSEAVQIQGHRLRWESIDLSQAWPFVENSLAQVIQSELAAS